MEKIIQPIKFAKWLFREGWKLKGNMWINTSINTHFEVLNDTQIIQLYISWVNANNIIDN